jgi:hypothetical protein
VDGVAAPQRRPDRFGAGQQPLQPLGDRREHFGPGAVLDGAALDEQVAGQAELAVQGAQAQVVADGDLRHGRGQRQHGRVVAGRGQGVQAAQQHGHP